MFAAGLVLLASQAGPGGGGGGPRAPDLDLAISQEAPKLTTEMTRFNVVAKNIGSKDLDDVVVDILLPLTSTSPQQYVLGTVGSKSPECSVAPSPSDFTKYSCALPKIPKMQGSTVTQVTLFFDIKLPQSAQPISLTAMAAVVPAQEVTPSNNAGSIVASQMFTSLQISPFPRTVRIRSCTGAGLTSFFECEISPGSISTNEVTFNSDGSITFPPSGVGYTGTWAQSGTGLTMAYSQNGQVVASFAGSGVTSDCFHGLTTFTTGGYVSPYEVCLLP